MSSTSDAYPYLLVQTLPKSILKKSPSPRFADRSVHLVDESHPHIALSSPSEAEKNVSHSNNQCTEKNILLLSPVDEPIMTSTENSSPYEVDHRLMRSLPCADSSSSSLASDDDQQKRVKTKTKKLSSRPAIANGPGSSTPSSDSNDERKVKRSIVGSKLTGLRSDKHRHKDMQLDEFMRKYQQQGGIHVPTNEDHAEEQTSAANPTNNDGNNYQQSSITHHRPPRVTNDAGDDDDDTSSFLTTMNTISLAMKAPSSLQLLFDVAHTDQCDRRTKIDRLRQCVEEQIGISAFLTIYKLVKSSQIPIDIRQKPFCYYAKFLPHLCCLIMLESEEQRNRL